MPAIEILSNGFGVVNRRLGLILVPLFLDFLLWLGPQVTAAPLASQGVELYDQIIAAAPVPYQPPPDLLEEQYHQIQSTFQALGRVNLLRLLATPLVLDVLASPLPSLVASSAETIVSPTAFYWGMVSEGRSLFALWVGLAAAGYLLASLYLSAIARSIKGHPRPWLREALQGWWKLVLFALLVVAGAVTLGLPLAMLLSLASFVVPEVASLLGIGLTVAVVVLVVGLFFVNPAFFVGEAGVLEGIRQSLRLVRRHLGSCLNFILLVTVIQWGITLAWGPLLGHPAGVLVAMVGNAYVVTGLAAAAMIFYQEKGKELAK